MGRLLVRKPQGAAQVLRVIKVVLRVIDHGALRLAVHDPAGAGGELRDSRALGLRGEWINDLSRSLRGIDDGPDPWKVDTSGVSYAAWVSVADVSASKSSGARRLHTECRLRVL